MTNMKEHMELEALNKRWRKRAVHCFTYNTFSIQMSLDSRINTPHWLFLNCMCFKWLVTKLNHSQLHGWRPSKAVRVHLICHIHCNATQSMNGRYTEYKLYEFKQLSAMCIVHMLKSNDEISNILCSTNINTQEKEVRSSVKGRTSIFGRYIYSTAKGAPFKPVNYGLPFL